MDFHAFNVSFTFVAICAASLFVLTGWVGVLRGKIDVLRADGGDADLFKRIRIHGNFGGERPPWWRWRSSPRKPQVSLTRGFGLPSRRSLQAASTTLFATTTKTAPSA